MKALLRDLQDTSRLDSINEGALLCMATAPERAIQLAENAVLRRKSEQGDDHIDTLLSMLQLACMHTAAGNHAAAIQQVEASVAELNKVGKGKPTQSHVAQQPCIQHLAHAHFTIDEPCAPTVHVTAAQAIKLQEQSRCRWLCTEGHQDTHKAFNMQTIAWLYGQAQQYPSAIRFARLAGDDFERTLGLHHCDTLQNTDILANYLSLGGEHAEAIRLQKMVLDTRSRDPAEDHPSTTLALYHLAQCYVRAEKYTQAIEHAEKASRRLADVFGHEDKRTMACLCDLASVYKAIGQHTESLRIGKKILPGCQKVMGEKAYVTLRVMSDLAGNHAKLGRREEAIHLWRTVWRTGKRAFGDDSPVVLDSMHGLTCAYSDEGQQTEAIVHGEVYVPQWRRIYGDSSPQALDGMEALALSYVKAGRYAKAVQLGEVRLVQTRKLFGEVSERALAVARDLACDYAKVKRYDEAINLGREVLKARESKHGETNVLTIDAMHNLACHYSESGQATEALILAHSMVERIHRTAGLPEIEIARGIAALNYFKSIVPPTARRRERPPNHRNVSRE